MTRPSAGSARTFSATLPAPRFETRFDSSARVGRRFGGTGIPLDVQDESALLLASKGMAEPTTEVIQGTLDMLILRSVELQPMHGFGITQRIEQISAGVFRVNPGSLLLAFQRMERAG